MKTRLRKIHGQGFNLSLYLAFTGKKNILRWSGQLFCQVEDLVKVKYLLNVQQKSSYGAVRHHLFLLPAKK